MSKQISKKSWKKFQDYIKTYSPEENGLNRKNVILHDLLYGIGLLLDEKEYEGANGYAEFLKMLTKKI